MKKYIISCMILGLSSAIDVKAQAFQKGTKNIEIGLDLQVMVLLRR